uniref:Uncharacterized protein n=1 Tax=Acrobeloides nanus TaxID=290746 RepID=A0A914CUZ9_9BILA
MYTRLDAPFGRCSSLDKLQELGQPFYFNGTYSTEGCLRSCFQEKLVANCSCADARIPLPSDTNVPFCSYLNETQEQCKTTYIAENGDYYAVQGCQCDISCEEQAYDAQLFESTWPDGGFLYEYYCTQYNTTKECQKFYSKNAVKVEVSYARMGYQSSDETPVNDMFKLLNNMAGNLGLWIGISAITLAEFLLVFIQIWLWCCTKTKELPDVPSLRYRNIEERSEREERTKMHNGHTQDAKKLESITNLKHASNNPEKMLIYRHNMAPKNFENELRKRSPTSYRPSSTPALHAPGHFDAPAKHDLYEEITPTSQYDSYLTTPKLVHESDLQHEPIP